MSENPSRFDCNIFRMIIDPVDCLAYWSSAGLTLWERVLRLLDLGTNGASSGSSRRRNAEITTEAVEISRVWIMGCNHDVGIITGSICAH